MNCLRLRLTSPLQPTPPGETFANAVHLGNTATASYNGSTVGYADNYNSFVCSGDGPGQIFTWTAPFSGSVFLSMCTSSDLKAAIYVLGANQKELACSNSESSDVPLCPSGTGFKLST